MKYGFPKLQFDRRRYVSLSQAFEQLGCYMFPTAWTGREVFAWQKVGIDTLRDQKDKLQTTAATKREEVKTLRELLIDEGDFLMRENLKVRIETAQSLQDVAASTLWDFQTSFKARQQDAVGFERKCAVIKELCRAIRMEELNTYLDRSTAHGSILDWAKHPQFRISFVHSHIYTPQNLGGRHKHSAHFLKQEFDEWLKPYEQSLVGHRSDDHSDALIEWFKGELGQLLAVQTRLTRQSFFEKCQTEFELAPQIQKLELKFDAVWNLFAPDEWRKGGKPRNPTDV